MSSSNYSSFGLEDLMTGIHRPVNNVSQDLQGLKSVEGFVNVVNDPDNNPTSFAMEAFDELANSNKFALYAIHSLESLQYETAILQKVKTRYGVEGLNPYTFSVEAGKNDAQASATKKKNIFARIWAAIVEAFRRLIIAIGNFIRNAMNHIQSALMKRQTKFYNTNKDKIAANLKKYGNETIKAKKPKSNVYDNVVKKAPEVLAKLNREIKKATGINDALTDYVTQVVNGKVGILTQVFKSKSLEGEKLVTEIVNIATFGGAKSYKYKVSEPAKLARTIFYGEDKVKTSTIKISELAKLIPFEILSDSAVKVMNDFVKNGRQTIGELNKALTTLRKAAATAEKVAGAAAKGGKAPAAVQKALSSHAKAGTNTQRVAGFVTGILLNTFKEFLACQSYAAAGMRAIMKGEKKAAKDTKKNK